MDMLYILLTFQLLCSPSPVASQTPDYDFWDDCPWDDLEKTTYRTDERDILPNMSVDECVNACLGLRSCVSLFYNPTTGTCERVPTNLLHDTPAADPTLQAAPDNRYFRYVPKGAEFCNLTNCYYYNRKVHTCWKVLYYVGNRDGHRLTYHDGERFCRKNSGKMAVLDTREKFEEANRLLVNFNQFHLDLGLNYGTKLRGVYIGARRANNREILKWINGMEVGNDSYLWHPTHPGNGACAALIGYQPPGQAHPKYRLGVHGCWVFRAAVLCEKEVPEDIVARETQITSTTGK